MPTRVPSRSEHSPDGSPGARDLGRRVLGIGEDPLGWSIPFLRVARYRLRVHVVFVAWIIGELIVSFRPDVHSYIYVAAGLTGILTVGLFRECIRFLALRSCGQPNATLVLWPLGVVAIPPRPDDPLPRPEIPLAGILASILAVGLSAAILLGVEYDPKLLLAHLLDPRIDTATLKSTPAIFAWWLYYAAVVVALANILLPAPGFDVGRLMQALLAQRVGAKAAARISSEIGLVVALVLFIVAATSDLTRIMAVAVLVAFAAVIERRRVTFLERLGPVPLPTGEFARPAGTPMESSADAAWERSEHHAGHSLRPGARSPQNSAEEEDEDAEQQAREAAPGRSAGPSGIQVVSPVGIDDVLDKISREGLSSLTAAERERLEKERRRLSGKPDARA